MSAQQRLQNISGHIHSSATTTQSPGLKKILEKNPDDIVRPHLPSPNSHSFASKIKKITN
jgi:hypothetical protein